MPEQPDFPILQLLEPIEWTASDGDLATVHLRDRFVLPASYCDFAQRYGCDFLPTRSQELSAFFSQGVEDGLFEYEPDGSPELIARLIPFGISEDGHYFAWDIDQLTGSNEYAIYVIGTKFLSVTRAADTLYELIAGCLDHRVKTILGPGYLPLPATFRPAQHFE